ncbi:hypothetical protein Q1695_004396 [Nippostrongylus brasiliensis]|nr:hypothetical protein Q1695_004396 [Nippostrongylus brasiliensis]
MKFTILFLLAIVAVVLSKPHPGSSSDSDEHKGKPHHPHRRTPPSPPPCVPVTTQIAPGTTDLPVEPTDDGPAVTDEPTSDQPDIPTENPDEGFVQLRRVASNSDKRHKSPHHKHPKRTPPPPPCPTGEVPGYTEAPVAPTEAEPVDTTPKNE